MTSKPELTIADAGHARFTICERHYKFEGEFGPECVCCQVERLRAALLMLDRDCTCRNCVILKAQRFPKDKGPDISAEALEVSKG